MEGLGKGASFFYCHDLRSGPTSYFFQNNRTRESSVAISPQWSMLEEIEFHRLAKLRLEVDEPDELYATKFCCNEFVKSDWLSITEKHMGVFSRMTSLTTALLQKPRNLCNLWIVSSTTRRLQTIPSSNR